MKTLIIDNYDSFTFNLYQMIAEVNGECPLVVRNDQMTWAEAERLEFDNIVLSPGPGSPTNRRDFGICLDALQEARVPLLGVCLGHQGIGHAFGGVVTHAPEPIHGRLSPVFHTESALFANIPQAFQVVRYHSLMVAQPLPDCLEPIAWTDEIVMGLRHRTLPFWGVQFHPESICTEYGRQLLENFRDITAAFYAERQLTRRTIWSGFAPPAERQPVGEHDYAVFSRRIDAAYDAEQVYIHLFAEDDASFWLDSSLVNPKLSRFSFVGGTDGPLSKLVTYNTLAGELTVRDHSGTVRSFESVFDYLNRELGQRACAAANLPFSFNGGFVGYFGYEMKHECGSDLINPAELPDAAFIFADRLIAFDHQEQAVYLVCVAPVAANAEAQAWLDDVEWRLQTLPPLAPVVLGSQPQAVRFRMSRSYETYIDDILRCQEQITNGESYEVCLTNQIHADVDLEPLALYRTLRRINPAPYAAFLRFGRVAIASSSPERFLLIDRERWVESKPIKGTRPRGRTDHEDEQIRDELQNCPKDRSENLMIVDLLRNDLGTVCEVGSVHVPKLMQVETYKTVHQLVSTIRGQLGRNTSAVDCVRRAFPGGSMTGAPKIRTMQIIDELEREARGVYSGAIGFLSLDGSADLNIVIRTIVITPGKASIGVGGAVVALSDPESEFEEILVKARAPIQAIMLAACGTYEPDDYQQIKDQFRNEACIQVGGAVYVDAD